MQTQVIKADCNSQDHKIINQASELIKKGGLVVLPTETVYGIAVNFEDKEALEKLFKIKERDKDKPLSVHIADIEEVDKYAKEVLPYAWRLMYKNWPGPLTAVLKSKDSGTIGLRLPQCGITRQILRKSETRVVMPSANKSGQAAPVNAEAALKDLNGAVDLIIDCGSTELGKESTVADFTAKEPKLLRQGAIDFKIIQQEAKKKRILFVCTGNSCRSVMAHFLLQKEVAKRTDLEIESAGIGALDGMPPTAETLDLLKKDEIEASGFKSRRLNAQMLKEADLVLVMGANHEYQVYSVTGAAKNKVYLLREFAKMKDDNLEVPDPIGNSYNFYRDTYYKIKEAILKIVELI
jgi:tRNA threonylcarbamoyl adenosine modification protein (Sua5/YciO/YrdC/YwlC family)